jgi:hypothetical protein
MRSRDRGSAARAKQHALAATGLIATAAAGGLAAVSAAEAQAASGAVHACYSKSTHVLKFSKKASCPKGSKLVTWNKQGPQGAPGAPGAQGPAGPAVGWGNERFTQDIPVSSSTVPVASFTPASTGDFAVAGFAEIHHTTGSSVGCYLQGGAGTTTNRTPDAFFSLVGVADYWAPITTGGIVAAGPTEPVFEYCDFSSAKGDAHEAEVTGVRLTTAHEVVEGTAAGKSLAATARHRFAKKASRAAVKKH